MTADLFLPDDTRLSGGAGSRRPRGTDSGTDFDAECSGPERRPE
ncbi:MAG: hypothetical protein ABIJ48_05365 [Actinomycetota bacterium]